MKLLSILIAVFLLATAALAMDAPATASAAAVPPPVPQKVLVETNADANDTIAAIVAVAPQVPRGPTETLQDYRAQMTLTTQTLSSELTTISAALRSGQITRVQAEYLIQQRAQLAAMQYEVFSALYDALAYEIAQVATAAVHPQPSPQSDSTVLVQGAPGTCGPTRTRSK
jgi:hypothetical protein